MIYNRYKMIEVGTGIELWAWVLWIGGLLGMIVIGSHSIGQLSAHDKYIHLVNGMVKQFEAGCEKPPVFKNVPVKE